MSLPRLPAVDPNLREYAFASTAAMVSSSVSWPVISEGHKANTGGASRAL
jgi:hypothetical protein